MERSRKVFIFGVFDGLHDGHRFFIEESAKLGKELIISVARDEYVRKYKDKEPKNLLTTRIQIIKENYKEARVIEGDSEIESWKSLREEKPDIIALGYDQNKLKEVLENKTWNNFSPEIVIIKPHVNDKLHSSNI
jgi:FAD synthetase